MIYLDHAAATPLDERVFEVMKPYYLTEFYNPSAAYLPAKKVASNYEKAKGTIAHTIGAKESDLVITAGATEANNLAFTAIMQQAGAATSPDSTGEFVSARIYAKGQTAHARVLYLETEHDSVRCVAEAYGGTPMKVLKNGLIDLEDLREKLTDETELVSIALVNSELGTIQPLSEVARILREAKIDRMRRGIRTQLLLHSDASQALNLLDINVARLGVDLMTLNAAKIYGPKGVGALYVSHEARLKPLALGGGQEQGLRSGTENVPGVIGFAKATELAHEHLNGNRKKYAIWRKILLEELNNYELINKKHALDNFVVVSFPGVDAERLVFALEDKGICVSTGAACAASKGVKSRTLAAIGLSDAQIAGSLRITLGETNSEEQIHQAAYLINEAVLSERRIANG